MTFAKILGENLDNNDSRAMKYAAALIPLVPGSSLVA